MTPKGKDAAALKAPRRPDLKQRPHHHAEVVRDAVDHVSLEDLHHATQPGSSRPSRRAQVRETPLRLLASQPLAIHAIGSPRA
jgi:hypothetical protein